MCTLSKYWIPLCLESNISLPMYTGSPSITRGGGSGMGGEARGLDAPGLSG